MIPKVLTKLPAITTGTGQLYIPMAPPVAHVGWLRGAINSCMLVQDLSCRSTLLREQYVQSPSTNRRGHIWYTSRYRRVLTGSNHHVTLPAGID
jgi:hypothetical protein